MKRLITSMVLFSMLFLASAGVHAQTNDDLAERAKMQARITQLEKEGKAKDEKIKTLEVALDTTTKKFLEIDALQEKRIIELKSSIAIRKEADDKYISRMEGLYEKSLSNYERENDRLREDNYRLRKSGRRNVIITAIVAVGAALLLK